WSRWLIRVPVFLLSIASGSSIASSGWTPPARGMPAAQGLDSRMRNGPSRSTTDGFVWTQPRRVDQCFGFRYRKATYDADWLSYGSGSDADWLSYGSGSDA